MKAASPTIMDQRMQEPGSSTVPARPVQHQAPKELTAAPEELIFDKAEEAATQEENKDP